MANFKVGDRVRVIADRSLNGEGRETVGKAGVIVRHAVEWPKGGWIVHVPGALGRATRYCAIDEWHCLDFELAPLTPPDAWAADAVRKVTRVHVEPVAPKVTV